MRPALKWHPHVVQLWEEGHYPLSSKKTHPSSFPIMIHLDHGAPLSPFVTLYCFSLSFSRPNPNISTIFLLLSYLSSLTYLSFLHCSPLSLSLLFLSPHLGREKVLSLSPFAAWWVAMAIVMLAETLPFPLFSLYTFNRFLEGGIFALGAFDLEFYYGLSRITIAWL